MFNLFDFPKLENDKLRHRLTLRFNADINLVEILSHYCFKYFFCSFLSFFFFWKKKERKHWLYFCFSLHVCYIFCSCSIFLGYSGVFFQCLFSVFNFQGFTSYILQLRDTLLSYVQLIKGIFHFFFFQFLFIYLFLDRGEGREKEKEGNINVWLPLTHSLLGTWPKTQACALTENQTGDPVVCRPALNPLSHTSQGAFFISVTVFLNLQYFFLVLFQDFHLSVQACCLLYSLEPLAY